MAEQNNNVTNNAVANTATQEYAPEVKEQTTNELPVANTAPETTQVPAEVPSQPEKVGLFKRIGNAINGCVEKAKPVVTKGLKIVGLIGIGVAGGVALDKLVLSKCDSTDSEQDYSSSDDDSYSSENSYDLGEASYEDVTSSEEN